jgi:hypothetical protein
MNDVPDTPGKAPGDQPAATIADLTAYIADLSGRIADRLPGPAPHTARITYWCARDGIPESTIRAVVAAGSGPRIYKVGRLDFVTRADWEAWHSTLAERGGVKLTGGRRDEVA